MYLPDKEALEKKEPLEIVEFWFNYWNELYPIDGLYISFENGGDIKKYLAQANIKEKKTVFNKERWSKFEYSYGISTARHEHVHQLLYHYGYDFNHTLLFALVDNALARAYSKLNSDEVRSEALVGVDSNHHKQVAQYHSPDNTIRHYDFHEDRAIARNVNTRLVLLLGKRLSRHCDDIEKLLATAKKYADYLSESAPTKRAVRSLRRENDYLQGVNDSAFQGWTDSATENQQLIAKLEETQEQVSYLNSLNMKWQGAFVLLAIIATAILVRVAP